MLVYGAEHPNTLSTAENLAMSLTGQGRFADAERIHREVHGVQKRVLGTDNPETLASAANLAHSLSTQGRYDEAEVIEREVLGMRNRVLGTEHPNTLMSANNLAQSLSRQGKHAEAETIQRKVLLVMKRMLGIEHPSTLTSSNNLATTLANQGKYAEAEQSLQAVLDASKNVLGTTHPDTLTIARSLDSLRAHLRGKPWSNAAAPTFHSVAQTLPAGTLVLLQCVVTKPEHNGKRVRVLAFDARSGRYTVALDNGKELSLKAKCVALAECAAKGCTVQEARSMCKRCQLVRYCSRECQRTDWKVHKSVCSAAALTS
jgi:tetratricopeptide (TPR) repeat protein